MRDTALRQAPPRLPRAKRRSLLRPFRNRSDGPRQERSHPREDQAAVRPGSPVGWVSMIGRNARRQHGTRPTRSSTGSSSARTAAIAAAGRVGAKPVAPRRGAACGGAPRDMESRAGSVGAGRRRDGRKGSVGKTLPVPMGQSYTVRNPPGKRATSAGSGPKEERYLITQGGHSEATTLEATPVTPKARSNTQGQSNGLSSTSPFLPDLTAARRSVKIVRDWAEGLSRLFQSQVSEQEAWS